MTEADGAAFEIEWVPTCRQGLAALAGAAYDVVLLDYRLGKETGLDFLGRMPLEERTPVILLTGQAGRETDLEAMRAGAADYLVKAEITATLLERSIRYVVEQRRAQEAKREAEFRYQMVVESAGAIVWQADPDTFEFSLVSREAEALLGYPVERWLEDPEFWPEHIHPEERAWVIPSYQETAARGDPHTLEYRMIAADGQVVWLRDVVRVVELGGRRQLVGVMIDVTGRKRDEELLRLRTAQLDQLFQSAPEGVVLLDEEDRVVRANPEFLRIFGYESEENEVFGRSINELIVPEEQVEEANAYSRRVLGGERVSLEGVRRRRDGSPVSVSILAVPVQTGTGSVVVYGIYRDITERVEAEKALRLQERSLAAISEGILITDPRQADNPIVHANPAFEQLTGYTVDEVVGKNCRILHGPGTDSAMVAAIRSALEAGESFTGEILNYRKDGTPFWNRLSVTPLHDDSGMLTHFVGVQQDVTERNRLIQELQAERSQLVTLFEQAPAFMASARGPEHVFEMANPRYYQLVGHRDLIGRSVREALPEVVDQGVVELLDQVYASGEPFVANEMPMMLQRKQDQPPEERILNFVYQPLREADGSVSGILAHGVDVTEQVRAQERLRTAVAHYHRLVSTAPQAIYALDAEGRFIELNPAGEILLERSLDDVIGQHFAMVVAPEDLPIAQGLFQRAMAGETEKTGEELHIVRPSGERRLLSVTIAPIEDGSVTGVHGIARDITEERAREQRMRMLAAALEGLPQAVSIATPEGEFLYTNAAHVRILGYEPGSAFAVGPDAFLPDAEAREQLTQILRTIDEGASWSGRIRRKRLSDGRIIPLDAIISRAPDAGGDLLFAILQDATPTIAHEQHLRRTERLASVGTLIGGVAHELNNPLHAIINFAQLLLDDPRPEEEREDLETIKREASRMAKIVSDLRLLARQTQDEEQGQKEPVGLNEVVRHVLKVRGYSLRTSNIEVREDLADDLPSVLADRGQLEQVLLNLVVNAEQAMATHHQGGRLILRTRPSRDGVSLYIVDNGPGIPGEHLDRIFDPFFTTKPPGEGTGLGLSLVHGIITEHGGKLRVESEVGKGAAFAIDLPVAPTIDATRAEAAAASTPARALRILVVDDEPVLRRSIERYLTRRGHAVDVASEGGEALRLLDGAGEAGYDAILSDLKMPGLSGEQLLTRLRERSTGLDRRLVFLTGQIAGGDASRLFAIANVPVLPKPIGLEEIAQTLERRAEPA